jgi:hypothetical protein
LWPVCALQAGSTIPGPALATSPALLPPDMHVPISSSQTLFAHVVVLSCNSRLGISFVLSSFLA